jgi:hypothetical protein
MSDETKKPSPQQQPKDKIEDLKQKPISDDDAQTVKGGAATIGKYAQ